MCQLILEDSSKSRLEVPRTVSKGPVSWDYSSTCYSVTVHYNVMDSLIPQQVP